MEERRNVEKFTSRSYVIQAENGNHYRRNRVHIRPNMCKGIQYDDIDLYDVLPSSRNTITYKNIPASQNANGFNSLIRFVNNRRDQRVRRSPLWIRDYKT